MSIEPRHGEHTVNTHTGRSKPGDEAFDPNRHGIRCYHGGNVSEAINHWGAFNGRDRDKQKSLALVASLEQHGGPVFEAFHIEMYVAVQFSEHRDTIGAYIHTGFIDTTVQASQTQFLIERGYWRHEFAGYGSRTASGTQAGPGKGVLHAECPCSPGMKAPIGSNCPSCESPIAAESGTP